MSQTSYWGQTFTVPAAQTFLNSVSFEYGWQIESAAVSGLFKLYKWSASGPTGPEVSSASFVTSYQDGPPFGGQASWGLTTFLVGLALDPGEVYVAYLEPVGSGYSVLPRYPSSNYTGGSAVQYAVVEGEYQWVEEADGKHLGFEADFSPSQQVVPEPATVFLLATGLLGVCGIGVARRRKESAA